MAKEKIRMRVNKQSNLSCEVCGKSKEQSLEMFDLMIGSVIHTLCDQCVEKVFSKTLSATCIVNHKIKSKKDLSIIMQRNESIYKCIESERKDKLSITEALSDMKEIGVESIE